ncbi:hypothetical protein MP638_003765 [Amoeboaphelidium occidentale]|nr:hypothetical protein MP638_003765 [Amoeboaphelidium occidentale]
MNDIRRSDVPNKHRTMAGKELIPMFRKPRPQIVGRSKALFIGINYFGSNIELRGCVNDVMNTKSFFQQMYTFPLLHQDAMILTDLKQNMGTPLYPTKENIIAALNWLTGDCQPGDRMLIHYSGHGGLKYRSDGTEIDGFDETIYPVDFDKNGVITDDDLNKILVKNLQAGSVLTCLFDSCHSGTVMDLPFIYDRWGRVVEGNKKNGWTKFTDGLSRFVTCQMSCKKQDPSLLTLSRDVQGLVLAFSSCEDYEVSSDVCTGVDGCFGVLSKAFVDALRSNPSLTYPQLLGAVQRLVKQYKQTPVLSSNKKVDLNIPFSM